MTLDKSGRFVNIMTIYKEETKILINNIIKGEHYVHHNSEFYTFRLARTEEPQYAIDYPESIKYPLVLKQILSGRDIVTSDYIPDLVYDDVRVSYEETVRAYKYKKAVHEKTENSESNQ